MQNSRCVTNLLQRKTYARVRKYSVFYKNTNFYCLYTHEQYARWQTRVKRAFDKCFDEWKNRVVYTWSAREKRFSTKMPRRWKIPSLTLPVRSSVCVTFGRFRSCLKLQTPHSTRSADPLRCIRSCCRLLRETVQRL